MILMIVHVDSAMKWRGGQQQVYLLHRQLRQMGVDSIVLAPRGSLLLGRCRDEGLEAIAGSRPWHLFSDPVRSLIKNCRIVHVHDSPSATMAAVAQRIWPNITVICHRRISYELKNKHTSRWKYRHVRHWICVNPKIKRQLLAAGAEIEKISVIPSAIDFSAIANQAARADLDALRAELDITQDAPIITSIGALVPQKAHSIVLEAAASVHETIPNVVFLVVGEGRLRSSLEAQARALGICAQLRFTGFRCDIPALLKLATIHIAASINGEGSPASIKEAMYIGTPVIASDIEAHRLIVGESGVLIPAGDAARLGATITSLLNDPDRLREMAPRAVKLVDRFRPEAMTDATLSVYQSTIGKKETL